MRIPLRRIYRAFEELDGFSDAECDRFVVRARAQRWILPWAVLASVGGLGVWLVGAVGGFLAMYAWGHRGLQQPGAGPSDWLQIGVGAAIYVSWPLFAALPALFVRDRLLRRAIRNRLLLVRCPRCRYSMLGLRVSLVDDGVETVVCPECGSRHVLAAIGLSGEDLIPRTDQPSR